MKDRWPVAGARKSLPRWCQRCGVFLWRAGPGKHRCHPTTRVEDHPLREAGQVPDAPTPKAMTLEDHDREDR